MPTANSIQNTLILYLATRLLFAAKVSPPLCAYCLYCGKMLPLIMASPSGYMRRGWCCLHIGQGIINRCDNFYLIICQLCLLLFSYTVHGVTWFRKYNHPSLKRQTCCFRTLFFPLMSASARGASTSTGGGERSSSRRCWLWSPGFLRCSCWSSSTGRSLRVLWIRPSLPARRRSWRSRTS